MDKQIWIIALLCVVNQGILAKPLELSDWRSQTVNIIGDIEFINSQIDRIIRMGNVSIPLRRQNLRNLIQKGQALQKEFNGLNALYAIENANSFPHEYPYSTIYTKALEQFQRFDMQINSSGYMNFRAEDMDMSRIEH